MLAVLEWWGLFPRVWRQEPLEALHDGSVSHWLVATWWASWARGFFLMEGRRLTPRTRRRIAATLAIVATIAWPATQLTIARDEPPFTLALSWFAIVLTAVDVLVSTDVRAQQDDDEGQ